MNVNDVNFEEKVRSVLPTAEVHEMDNGSFTISLGANSYLGRSRKDVVMALDALATIEAQLGHLGQGYYSARADAFIVMYEVGDMADVTVYAQPASYYPRIEIHIDDAFNAVLKAYGGTALTQALDALNRIYNDLIPEGH